MTKQKVLDQFGYVYSELEDSLDQERHWIGLSFTIINHYTVVNAQEDITAHKKVLQLIIFRFYGFIKIMSNSETSIVFDLGCSSNAIIQPKLVKPTGNRELR
ncbi:hypothetical protein PHYBLDRAFT_168474 [Phycomyces blakesleeanus NRRL 1555(-)]|uniref:Uncharacterized protein n=1 Tax=Phycomyces blakesleeanus (strain ATCC 8743b / DSM 1359 / FGSC 10004 / NBRC 33097 / NRRL 1555) TaxID=763407 RepID=A0A162PLS8_PHYB8|nr:hypothetical protein PHYBLDRAFT_175161 [Phycomyces blakesleeanus NRRL 1555(-)]XP_018292107.1 hypothetical protein PHYBLDRAFT_168474 [Phycomyces blakesleeanus NRRL 1555(-)]OAD66616.1 hypothetical protein PHYBLDRAFT_175161 [Phycomyces blakesleeanus NRRL 1555(-)]OAD74067.1 hypothetical protein PHYBLDRAFT_168474 [Phycomyces blakesleeanus NRRL 1555(-)]|eukprot:XP_018284656.1 hypothetical protein PHYBLDRAFT_175161 [Phycomyces blakesleeanus NRRL 1555(-)]